MDTDGSFEEEQSLSVCRYITSKTWYYKQIGNYQVTMEPTSLPFWAWLKNNSSPSSAW